MIYQTNRTLSYTWFHHSIPPLMSCSYAELTDKSTRNRQNAFCVIFSWLCSSLNRSYKSDSEATRVNFVRRRSFYDAVRPTLEASKNCKVARTALRRFLFPVNGSPNSCFVEVCGSASYFLMFFMGPSDIDRVSGEKDTGGMMRLLTFQRKI